MFDGLDKSEPQMGQALLEKRVLLFVQVAPGLDREHLELVNKISGVLKLLDGLAGLRIRLLSQKNQRHVGVFGMTMLANRADIILSCRRRLLFHWLDCSCDFAFSPLVDFRH